MDNIKTDLSVIYKLNRISLCYIILYVGVTLKAKFASANTLLKDVNEKLQELIENLPGMTSFSFVLLVIA